MTPKKVVQYGIMLDAVLESVGNAGRTYADPWHQTQQVLAPLADGIIAAKTFGKAASSPATSPGLIGDLWNMRLDLSNVPDITIRRAANALPSAVGWGLGIRRYQAIRSQEPNSVNQNVLPRVSAMTGIKLRNAKAIGGAWLATAPGGKTAPRDLFKSAVSSPIGPVVVGGAASRAIAKAHVF
jgi:hypothetical protein